jgi:hypothetical protein
MIQIPVTNQPNQSFDVVIPQGESNITLTFFIFWNRIARYWEMNVSNASTGVMLIAGLPMITGQVPAQNLLRQWAYLNIGEAYIVPISNDTPDYPGETDWGVNFALIWGP